MHHGTSSISTLQAAILVMLFAAFLLALLTTTFQPKIAEFVADTGLFLLPATKRYIGEEHRHIHVRTR